MDKQRQRWLRNFVGVLLVLGIIFRFYNLDRKVYWFDETMTSLRVSGNTPTTLIEGVYTGEVLTVQDLLQQYQYPNPQRGLDDTLTALQGNPEHSPLYYLMARVWFQSFGDSVFVIRLMSALLGLWVLPIAYWLGRELWGSAPMGWAIAAVMAISPFHVLYSQEAREYSLWTVSILLSSATLLWAMRRDRPIPWSLYGVTVALGLYTHPFSAFVSISHGIYVFATQGLRWTRQVTTFLWASGLGALLFLPWLWVVVQHFTKFVDNTASVNLDRAGFLPLFWLLNLSRLFFDLNQGPSPFNPLHYILAGLTGYAFYYLYRKSSLAAWIFVITLAGVMGLALLAPDMLLGGRRSSITRYAIPSYIGIQIAVAYLFAHKLTLADLSPKLWTRWRNGAIALACCGILSCAVSSQIPVWWHKSYAKSRYNPPTAAIINAYDHPLVISDQIPGELLAFAHLLRPDVHLQIVENPRRLDIASGFSDVILFKPSSRMQRVLQDQQGWHLEPLYDDNWIWRVSDRPETPNPTP